MVKKKCNQCKDQIEIAYRVRYLPLHYAQKQWVFLCRNCLIKESKAKQSSLPIWRNMERVIWISIDILKVWQMEDPGISLQKGDFLKQTLDRPPLYLPPKCF